MAFKKYGYYLKGNKIAVIEQSDATSSGNLAIAHCTVDPTNNTTKDTCEAAGGQWIPSSSGGTGTSSEYASPTESVVGGLEIQYAYSPRYMLGAGNIEGKTKLVMGAWHIDDDNYLNFWAPTYALDAEPPSMSASPFSNFAADKHFLVTNSNHWNGLHKVQTLYSNGYIQTYTKASKTYNTGQVAAGFTASHSDGYIYGSDSNDVWINLVLSVGDFVMLDNLSTPAKEGLYKVTSITEVDGGAESAQKAYLGTKYFLNQEDEIDEWQTGDSSLVTDTAIVAWKVIYDPCYIYANVNVLEDETFELDISRYQANAVVYYLKAKLAEDRGDIEQREFFLREFKRQLEKGNSALKRGPYMIQGFKEMR